MKLNAVLFVIYGLILLAGGLVGFFKAHSLASLVMGSVAAIAMLISSFFIRKSKNSALYFALFLTLVLDGFFTFRYYKTQSFMPSGLMFLIGSSVIFGVYFNSKRQKLL